MTPSARSERWRSGFGLALVTAVLWGAVPLALTPIVSRVDPVTISWFRFAFCGVILFTWFAVSGRLRISRQARARVLPQFVLAVVALVGNYVLYVWAMHYIPAPVAQIVIQIAPVLLMLCSLWVFDERFSAFQWTGFALLLLGIGAFCGERLRVSGADLPVFGAGVGLMLAAAVSWTIYGLAQKRLLAHLPSQYILMGIYLAGTLMMMPMSRPPQLLALNTAELLLLGFLGLNTLIAYGAFAEALNRWESSKVSAVLALQPLTTLFGAHALGSWLPQTFPDVPLTPIAVAASLAVVAGSMSCALGGQRRST
jgi:drug/metabolite transporter (DMT)-like permease